MDVALRYPHLDAGIERRISMNATAPKIRYPADVQKGYVKVVK